MSIELSISPAGHLLTHETADGPAALPDAVWRRLQSAFADGTASGLLRLAAGELQTTVPPGFAFVRDLGRAYLTRLCHTPDLGSLHELPPIDPPDEADLATMILRAPPMRGLEYLTVDVLRSWWLDLDALVRQEARSHLGGVEAYLREKNPLWRLVGRVTFHLAENKRDPENPFAFLATYATQLNSQGKVQHLPLGRAMQEYAGAKNRSALLSLLTPVQRASERSELAKELVDSGEVYHPLAWTPREAYRFLKDVPAFEESGLIVRVPDWWKRDRPPRPVVSVKVGDSVKSKVGAEALLDFSTSVVLDGQPLSESELQSLLGSTGGLVQLKGKWVEVDREKLSQALSHWKDVERAAKVGGLSFFEGMRLLSGAMLEGDAAAAVPEETRQWTGIQAGAALDELLRGLRDPGSTVNGAPSNLRAQLRPYQNTGFGWLRFMTRLGLGACLADDMGLGKTVQVIALLLHLKNEPPEKQTEPSLLVVPASLIANWKSEIVRFAPSLSIRVVHPSEMQGKNQDSIGDDLDGADLVITTYGMLTRLEALRRRTWRLVILDEAQAIKNSGTRQTHAVKEIKASGRVALTGTPIENRLSDLWSLFDFLNPGLLGGPKAFKSFTRKLESDGDDRYGPLRSLVRPYILRRLKTDRRIIADLPDKVEVNAYCGLSRKQAALYEQTVRELAEQLKGVDGIQRRGVVLASLMRLKQICNHPSQLTGDGSWEPQQSGKFERLAELCQELAERQQKVLVFTQFREICDPLAEFLAGIFGQPGLVLHGGTPVPVRRQRVEAFQLEDGPPFFVLSLKAGGTGLNLTAASNVIHFDRWWNPAVENQATDRAFRIGQKRNVLVHKFVCRGTVEDRIDELIAQKSGLAKDLLEGGGEVLLTEMNNEQLLRFVALDINKATES